ncbi:MAG: hypothetical protein R3C03_15560 [Pirellulaceae bacterium]
MDAQRRRRAPWFYLQLAFGTGLALLICPWNAAIGQMQPINQVRPVQLNTTHYSNSPRPASDSTPAPVYQVETENFIVRAADANLAKQVAHQAEQFRKSLAVEWLEHELPTWQDKCPIQVEIGPHSGGETSFLFDGPPDARQPTQWSMKIFGPPDRLLDAVLPHEITHTIFATHFGRALPRWADEGACTTVEHPAELAKIQKLLIEFLTARPSRGIPLNRLFVMMQYPEEMLPLYAQSYSIARFLIQQHGRAHFVRYVDASLQAMKHPHDTDTWDQFTQQFYGYEDLSELSVTWQTWVQSGSPDLNLAVAANAVHRNRFVKLESGAAESSAGTVRLAGFSQESRTQFAVLPSSPSAAQNNTNSWYAQQMSNNGDDRQAVQQFRSASGSFVTEQLTSPLRFRQSSPQNSPAQQTSELHDGATRWR